MKIPVVKEILHTNLQQADENRATFDAAGVFTVNLMASPGAGKTSLILAMVETLPADVRLGVIEGDVASSIDAETIAARGIPVVQINTGGSCHLAAPMVASALDYLPLDEIDLLVIENVGNLICTAEFALGAHLNVVVASAPEGSDKPYKYPGIFVVADAVVLNKSDLLDVFAFDVDYFRRGITMVNPDAPMFPLSCRTGDGVAAWTEWLVSQVAATRATVSMER